MHKQPDDLHKPEQPGDRVEMHNYGWGTSIGKQVNIWKKVEHILDVEVEYQRLMEERAKVAQEIEEKAAQYASSDPEDKNYRALLVERLTTLNQRKESLDADMAKLKQRVYELVELIERTPISSERLRRAKAALEQGQLDKAQSLLAEDDMRQERDDVRRLLTHAQTAQQRTQEQLEGLADEYLFKAKLAAANFLEDPAWEQKTRHYYREALDCSRSPYTLHAYGLFLYEQKDYPAAEPYYREALQGYRQALEKAPTEQLRANIATILNNLAALQAGQGEVEDALKNYREALEIRRELAEQNPMAHGLDYAKTLILGVLLSQPKEQLDEAENYLAPYGDLPEAQKLRQIIEDHR